MATWWTPDNDIYRHDSLVACRLTGCVLCRDFNLSPRAAKKTPFLAIQSRRAWDRVVIEQIVCFNAKADVLAADLCANSRLTLQNCSARNGLLRRLAGYTVRMQFGQLSLSGM
jgi:hypothetical protein